MKRFVVFEGIDGSGKSTISRLVYDELKDRGIDAILTYEPYNRDIGNCIENFLKDGADPLSIAHLFIADRIEHSKLIDEWIRGGSVVVCDRYEDSTYAYQGAQLGDRVENPIDYLREITPDIVHPDRVYLLDIDPETSLSRLSGDRSFEGFERRDFLRRVRENYLKIAEEDDRFLIIDAERQIEEIVEKCIEDIVGDLYED